MGTWGHESRFSNASGMEGLPYVVMQVTLKEKFLGTGSGCQTANCERRFRRFIFDEIFDHTAISSR